ncbi:MAG: tetratricopeptide repeat protein, partial [Heliobacteriaceae bacterium]|nr:tetratricopeptide repeat protein [Heliobacteriaceae bacterium]
MKKIETSLRATNGSEAIQKIRNNNKKLDCLAACPGLRSGGAFCRKLLAMTAFTVAFILTCGVAAADEPTLNPQPDGSTAATLNQPKRAVLSVSRDIDSQYAIAYDRFMQSNIKSAYQDFRMLLESIIPNDYSYMNMAEKMAEIGLFNLSDLAISKVSDKEITNIAADDIRTYYFPSKKLRRDDETYLAELYSDITYNDRSREAVNELVKNTALMTGSDYANYIAALGYLKSGDPVNAEKFIDSAIKLNEDNINYKRLKAEILAQGKKPEHALKIVEEIKKKPFSSYYFANKAQSLEQYVLYKIKKNEFQKNYHLAYYYYYEGELNKSLRALQGAVSTKKKMNGYVYALMSRVYFDMNEFEKAQETAMKAYKIDRVDPVVLLVLGDLNFRNKNYKPALDYYKAAVSKDKNSSMPLIRVAQTYQMLDKEKKAMEIYDKVLRTFSDGYRYLAYYNVALKDKSKELAYLKKSVAINMGFKDGWIDLGRVEIER